MKKIIAAALLAVLILAGCGREDRRLRTVESNSSYHIYVDTETGVCYVSQGFGMTVLLDHNGKPYIANGWRDWGGDDE